MERLMEILESLAQRMGVAVDELAPRVVYHTRVCGLMQVISGLVAFIVSGSVCLFCIKSAREIIHKESSKQWYERTGVDLWVGMSLLCGLVVIISFVITITGIPSLIEPVGATVKKIIGSSMAR